MARSSFLDKFSRARRPHGPRDSLEHVMRNVQAVLNTKEGYGSFLPGFGLGSYAEKSETTELLQALTAEIQQEVSQHEPRLKEVEVEPRGRDSALWLHFELRAVHEGQRCRFRILFDTATGQVRLEERETA